MRFPQWPFWVWPAGALVAVVVFSGIAWLPHFTTSDATYCLTCHGTGETPDQGVPSRIHPDFGSITCTECHAKKGNVFLTEGYRGGYAAEAERITANCQRCHQEMITDEQPGYEVKGMDGMEINVQHRLHVEELGVLCVDCHRNVAHDSSSPPTNRPRMEYCYQCHSQTDSCMKCHLGGIPPIPSASFSLTPPPTPTPVPGSTPVPTPTETPEGITTPTPNVTPEGALTPAPTGIPAATATPTPVVTPEETATPIPAPEVEGLYQQLCAMCHGAEGDSIPSANLTSKEFLSSHDDASLTEAIAEGVPGMPSFGQAQGGPLTDEETVALVALMRSWER